MSVDPYEVLGVPRGASRAEIRRAYLTLARRHHPDRGGDPAAMQAVNAAWAVLGDPARRRAWDAEHRSGRVWVASPPGGGPGGPGGTVGWVHGAGGEPPDLDILDDRPLTPPRRSPVDLLPVALFAAAVAAGCLAMALDTPGLLAAAGLLFFLSCLGMAAVALLAMRRSARAGRQ